MAAVQTRRPGVVLLVRWIGLLGGLAVVSVLLDEDETGRSLLIIGPLIGVALLAGVLGGELITPRPERGPARTALLETREVTDYLPGSARWVARLVIAYAVVTVGAGAVGAVPGGWIGSRCSVPSSWRAWPVADYTAPGVVVVAVGLGLAGVVLHRLVARPRPADTAADIAADDLARRETAAAVVAGCAVLVAVPLGGTSLVAGLSLSGNCVPAVAAAGWLLVIVALVATVGGLWALGALLLRR